MLIALVPPPAGETANFVNPVNQMPNNIALYTICLSLATGGLILRMYTRLKILRASPGLDDSYHLGIGRHIWDEPTTWIVPAFKYFTIAQYIYLIMTATIKLTFLAFYYRVFAHVRSMRLTIVGGMAFIAVSHTLMVFLTVFSCSPISAHWDVFNTTAKCWPEMILPYASGALSSSSDLFVLLLPIHSLWKLNMKVGSRIRIIGVFGVGGFACVSSLIRLGMTHILNESKDTTWNISHLAIWAVLECNIGIWCSCLMLLPKFIEHSFPGGFMTGFTRLWSRKSSKHNKDSRKGSKDSTDFVPLSENTKTHIPRQESPSFGESNTVSKEARLSGSRSEVHDFV
ncbi:hypothetical protein N7486_000665 [Penicillium sp. IBT 16267x]|nr:hypothetical protein N7486_000665 [Penicillium sp. IBT 16267x]